MKQYTNGKRVIYATENAYKIIYKNQGFKEVKESDEFQDNKKITNEEIGFESLKVEELKTIAKEKGVEGYSKMKKEELIETLKGD